MSYDTSERRCEICGCDMSEFGIHKPITICDECEIWAYDESCDALDRTDACYEHDSRYYDLVGEEVRKLHSHVRKLRIDILGCLSGS